MVLGAVDTDLYKAVLVLHILTALVGLGAVFLNGLYATQARAGAGAEGLAVAETNFRVSKVAEWFIYGILVTGVLMVLMSDDVYGFGQTWIWLSLVLYVVGLGVSHGLMIPSARRMLALMREAPTSGAAPADFAAIERRMAIGGGFLNALTVVLIVLMVWKPGA